MGSQRLKDIECELGEQKKSTAKITKLCLAAIKALESLENRSPGLAAKSVDINSLDGVSCNSMESVTASPVDPLIVKTICEQLDVINKLLVKVDDDIESVDQKAETALADFEDMDRRVLGFEQKMKENKDTIMGEVRALLVSRTYATREDLSRAIAQEKQQQASGLGREEVAGMIERATSNFLKTMKADTASCSEKTQDCEEMVKTEVARLGSKIEQSEELAKRETRQLKETTDKSMKEVTRTLATLVEQHRSKASTENAEAFDRLNRRLDNEVKNFTAMVKEVKDMGLKEADESKLLSRLEKLGRDVSALRAEQAKLNSGLDVCLGKADTLDTQTKTVAKVVEQQKEEVAKMGRQRAASKEELGKINRVETALLDLGQRVDNQSKDLLDRVERQGRDLMEKQKDVSKDSSKLGKEEVEKVGKLERAVGELGQRMDSTGRLADTLVAECSRKVDKTELDDIRSGMEKERCKINYFQDKILHIAKVAEAAKTENLNLKDKLATDVGSQDTRIQNLANQIEKQTVGVKENSEALKGITKDSIGKIKEVAQNCVQIEANIRSVREKSIIFDNELKQIKDKIAQTEYKLENKDQDGAKEVKRILREKEEETKRMADDIESMKKKVQMSVMELGNFKEDKRTREGENEERQMNLEQNLLDTRGYVEQMLQETNKQLTAIAGDVEAADRKISRCAADIGDVLERQENSSGTSSKVVSSLETQMKELQEQMVERRVDWAGELLELRGPCADSKAEMLGKMEASGQCMESLRRETKDGLQRLEGVVNRVSKDTTEKEKRAGGGLQGLETQVTSLGERLGKVEGAKKELWQKVADVEKTSTRLGKDVDSLNGLSGGLSESKAEVKSCKDTVAKVHLKVDGLQQAEESRAAQVRSVKEALAKMEREGLTKKGEDGGKLNLFKEELSGVVRTSEAARKEVDIRIENMRKNMIEMIGANEMKTAEAKERVDRADEELDKLKVLTKNNALIADNKVKETRDAIENLLNDKFSAKSGSTLDLEKANVALRKEIEQVKNDLRNNDLESFKNIVNSTNDTHNKLISSIQKNVDQMIRDKSQQEGVTMAMEEKISKISVLREAGEQEVKRMIQKEQEVRQHVEEKVLALQMSLRELQTGVEGLGPLQTGLSQLRESVGEMYQEMEASVTQQKSRMAEMEELLKSEMTNIKGSGTVVQQSVLDQFTEVSRNIQEKSALADTRLNESLEVVEGHTKQLEKLQGLSEETKKRLENNETELAKIAKKCETGEAELSKVEFKVNSCVEELAKMDQFAKVAEVRKLEKTVAEKSGSSEAKEVQEKLSKLSQETTDSLRGMNDKQTSLGVAVSGVQAEVKKLADMGGVTEDLGVISSKVNENKAKLIDLEANVSLQERSNGKLSEDFKKMSETLTENKASMDQKLEKLEGTKKELVLAVSDMGKANTTLGQELASLTGLKTKAPAWDRKAETTEVDRLNTLLTEEVNKIQKEMKELRKKAEEIQTEASSKKEPTEPAAGQVQLKDLDSNFSRLSEIVENLQGRLTSQQG